MLRNATCTFALLLLADLASAAPTSTNTLTADQLLQIKNNLAGSASNTWVAGTRAEALLELDYPSLSIFSSDGTGIPSAFTTVIPNETVSIAHAWASIRPSYSDQFAEVSGGAAGDPASLGVAWIWAAITASNTPVRNVYLTQVDEEVNYLLNSVPRLSDGTISMRPTTESVQLWSDFIYMVPPFLAFYGATNNNATVLMEAYHQIRLYRNHLRDPLTGLWRHIQFGSFQDDGFWSTGNGWAAAGMTRVLATFIKVDNSTLYGEVTANLANWINEILDSAFAQLSSSTNLLPNYYNSKNTFDDAASSALLAATAYRISSLGLTPSLTNVATADKIRSAVFEGVGRDGWISPVVDPLDWIKEGSHSPEAQAFTLLLQAAWIDWLATQ